MKMFKMSSVPVVKVGLDAGPVKHASVFVIETDQDKAQLIFEGMLPGLRVDAGDLSGRPPLVEHHADIMTVQEKQLWRLHEWSRYLGSIVFVGAISFVRTIDQERHITYLVLLGEGGKARCARFDLIDNGSGIPAVDLQEFLRTAGALF